MLTEYQVLYSVIYMYSFCQVSLVMCIFVCIHLDAYEGQKANLKRHPQECISLFGDRFCHLPAALPIRPTGQQAPSEHPLVCFSTPVLEAHAWVVSGPSFQWGDRDPERGKYMFKVLHLYKIKPRFEPREFCSKARLPLLLFPVCLRMCRRVGKVSWNSRDTHCPTNWESLSARGCSRA